MTLDGIMEAPGREEHPDGKNSWALQLATEDLQRFKIDEIFGIVTRTVRELATGTDLVFAPPWLGRPPGCPWRMGAVRGVIG